MTLPNTSIAAADMAGTRSSGNVRFSKFRNKRGRRPCLSGWTTEGPCLELGNVRGKGEGRALGVRGLGPAEYIRDADCLPRGTGGSRKICGRIV